MFKKYDKDKQHLIIHNHKEWNGEARLGKARKGKGALCPLYYI